MRDLNTQLWLHLTLLQLLEENRTDSLTGILNRRGFEEALIQLNATAQRYQRPLSLILIDMCGLKRLNQQQGHVAGDQALKTLVQNIQLNKRNADIIARVGGDEFALLLPETSAQQALRAIQRIQSDLHRKHIEISYGIAQTPSEDLYAEADQQLNK
ncbi:MAG: GGDEF domain-containing protein [Pontiellaceae bacterium]